MKNIILLIGLTVVLSGCAASDYYTRPDSSGYTEPVFGVICENCGRIGGVSAAKLNSGETNLGCPYCGKFQNLQMARNRFEYERQRVEAAQNQQALANFFQARQQHQQKYYENQQQILQNYQKTLNRPGSSTNPIHVEIEN